MGERISAYFPYVLAVVLPPVGVLLGLVEIQNGKREAGMQLIAISVIVAMVGAMFFFV